MSSPWPKTATELERARPPAWSRPRGSPRRRHHSCPPREAKWSHFTISCRVAMPGERDYSRIDRWESRFFLANRRASCPAPHLSIAPRFRLSSSSAVATLSAGVPSRSPDTRGRGWLSCSMKHRGHIERPGGGHRGVTPQLRSALAASLGSRRLLLGGAVRARAKPIFPPRDQAIVKAIACEAVSQTQLPLSRLSTTDLAAPALHRPRAGDQSHHSALILDADVIKPWRYKYSHLPPRPAVCREGRTGSGPVC